jgi:hypothetical protein
MGRPASTMWRLSSGAPGEHRAFSALRSGTALMAPRGAEVERPIFACSPFPETATRHEQNRALIRLCARRRMAHG